MISSAGDAALSVADPSGDGRLRNGALALAQPLQARANGGVFAPLGTLASWAAPVSNAPVTIEFRQSIGAAEPLRTGTYSKSLTFTLSTTRP